MSGGAHREDDNPPATRRAWSGVAALYTDAWKESFSGLPPRVHRCLTNEHPDQLPSSVSLSLCTADVAVADDLARSLRRQLNQPNWPPVTIAITPEELFCSAETWQPILRVRVEDALEELLGPTWEEIVMWHDGADWMSARRPPPMGHPDGYVAAAIVSGVALTPDFAPDDSGKFSPWWWLPAR